ncbi:hypothetical protein ACH5AL_15420 [Actinacidiphila glaucinigra]|uniref:hypothetical protein n=1 Tax=Actinacidiphila glaucinigra TaxID=235986 RepID=UPI00378B4815
MRLPGSSGPPFGVVMWTAAQHVISRVLSQPDYRRPSAADLADLLSTALVDAATVSASG